MWNQNKLKITFVGYLHGTGGIQTHTRYLANGLAERGHVITVVTPPARSGHSLFCGNSDKFNVVQYTNIANALVSVRKSNPEVTVVCGVGYKAMLSVLMAWSSKKIFFEVMSGASLGIFDPRRLVHLGFDAVVGQGSAVSQKFAQDFSWRGPLSVIPALPEPLEKKVPEPLSNGRLATQDGTILAAYFGRLVPHKNVEFLVRYWREMFDCGDKLDIWGTGPEEENLVALIQAEGLQEQVKVRGRYPAGSEYLELLQSYDLTLLPTVGDEGAPLVLLESMAAGIPFVANGVGSIGDYANSDSAITSGEIEEFVPLVKKMILRLKSGDIDNERLRAYYVSEFGFERLIGRWESLLLSL